MGISARSLGYRNCSRADTVKSHLNIDFRTQESCPARSHAKLGVMPSQESCQAMEVRADTVNFDLFMSHHF